MKTLFSFYYSITDPRSPWYAKMTALFSMIYLISPVDIVPDIVPLAGYIDDVVIVPFLLKVASRLIPSDVKLLAEQKARKNRNRLRWAMAGAILLLLALMTALAYLAGRLVIYIKDN